MRVGKFLVVEGAIAFLLYAYRRVTGTSSARLLPILPAPMTIFLREVLAGSGTFGTINLTPMLMFTRI